MQMKRNTYALFSAVFKRGVFQSWYRAQSRWLSSRVRQTNSYKVSILAGAVQSDREA